jgi:hypothetical protein
MQHRVQLSVGVDMTYFGLDFFFFCYCGRERERESEKNMIGRV